MALDLITAGYLLAAAAIAIVVRFYDTPVTDFVDPVSGKILWKNILPTVVGAIIAAPLGAWILGLNVLDPKGFVLVVATAYAGMAAIKALVGLAVTEVKEAIAK